MLSEHIRVLRPGEPAAGVLPAGWVLIRARLKHAAGRGARLLIESPAGSIGLEVPVSPGGSVFELIELPRDVRQIVWHAPEHTPLLLQPLGRAARVRLMLRRVAYTLWTRSHVEKRYAGMSWLRAIIDLPGQYRAAGRLRGLPPSLPYREWLTRYDQLHDSDRELIRRRIQRMKYAPHIGVIVLAPDGADSRSAASVASVQAQLYPHRTCLVATPGSPPALPPEAQYVMVLEAGDRLPEHSLYWVAEAIALKPDAKLVYSDDDAMDARGERSDPRFKPDWSPEHLRSLDYIGRAAIVRRREWEASGGIEAAADAHQLLLGLASRLRPADVAHVPAVLLHRGAGQETCPQPRVRYAVPTPPPLVSIVVPTRDAVALLRRCVESLRARTTYPNYELIVVDNQSTDPQTLAYLATLERVLRYPAPYNYAAINNFAARQARGEALLLLNNDTEIITPDWIEEMLGHLCREGVGAVGAKLYYPDDTVQHAGDAVGIGGGSDHMHNGLPRGDAGYCHRAAVAQEVSAVTGACLLTWRRRYLDLGGLDEKLPVSFNDVDYCLRLERAGLRVVFTPHAELYHHESATRRHSHSTRDEARALRLLRRRWRNRVQTDPYYNPNLNRYRADFSVGSAPRVAKPWLR